MTETTRAIEARAPAPFVKWAGGKGRVLPQLLPLLPERAASMRHVEPFAGGAALFFARRPARALLGDINGALMDVYMMVRDHVEDVIAALRRLAARHDERHYYRERDRYNAALGERTAAQAARFIYLNKTCFNGLHRVNREGAFNVPFGRYVKPRILDVEGLRASSSQLRSAELSCASFETIVDRVAGGDFVYLDPPYQPRSSTASFTAYASAGFGDDDQRALRDVFDALARRGVACMLSNSDTPLVRELYRGFDVRTISAPRSVNSDPRKRGVVRELVVRSYVPARDARRRRKLL